MTEALMRGALHESIPVGDVRPEDIIEYEPTRFAVVVERHDGYKHKFLVCEKTAFPGKKFKVFHHELISAWRRKHGERQAQ